MMQRNAWLLCLMVAAAACQHTVKAPTQSAEAVICGRAPLNHGGTLRVFSAQGGEALKVVNIDAEGWFVVKIGTAWRFKNFVLEARGGRYQELATGDEVETGGQGLMAMVEDLGATEHREVTVSPWTHLAYVKSRADPSIYKQTLIELTTTLTCGAPDYRTFLEADPLGPAATHAKNVSPASLSRLYLGALSQLAADMGHRAKVGSGSRITSMSLLRALAADLQEGAQDGLGEGNKPIELLGGVPLPAQALRQPLAQAARRFVREKQGMTEAAVHDLLNCAVTYANKLLGPADARLDVEGPTLVTTGLPTPAILHRTPQELTIRVVDPSGVASLSAEMVRDERRHPLSLTIADADHAAHTFLLQLAPQALDDGEYSLRLVATDVHGNEREQAHGVTVNNDGGTPTLRVKRDGRNIAFHCRCDDPYVEICDLDAPSRALTGLRCLARDAHATSYVWDSTQVFDGDYTVTCLDKSRGLPPNTTSQTIAVCNTGQGRALGGVYADSVVHPVHVAAYALVDGRQGRLLGEVEAADGVFDNLALAADYRGPVLLRATDSQLSTHPSAYDSLAFGGRAFLGAEGLTLLLEDYEPGVTYHQLNINAATTLAEIAALAIWTHQPAWARGLGDIRTVATASRLGHRLVGQHIAPFGELDVRHGHVANFAEPGPFDSDAILLGLFHVGLSQLAADASAAEGAGITSVHLADVLKALRDDFADGVLDGKNRDRSPQDVRLSPNVSLGPDFLRLDLARAIERWLQARKQAVTSHRLSPLPDDDLRRSRGMLARLADKPAPLYGFRPGKQFDTQGPSLRMALRRQDRPGPALQPSAEVGGILEVEVHAVDPSGVASIRLLIGDKQVDSTHRRGDTALFEVDTRAWPDGHMSLTAEATDNVGAQSRLPSIDVVISNTTPTVGFPEGGVWTKGPMELRAPVTKALRDCRLEGAPPGSRCQIDADGLGLSLDLDDFATDGHHLVTVFVTDRAGNQASSPLEVWRDTTPPQITFTFVGSEHGPDEQEYFEAGTGHLILRRRIDRLDWLPGEPRPAYLPAFHFTVHDLGQTAVGTETQNLKVSYRYRFTQPQGEQVRDWQPMTPEADGQYVGAISYQTLLPRELLAMSLHESRARNFLAHSTDRDLHQIDFRVVDRAGNETVVSPIVRMQALAPPIVLSCALSQELRDTRVIPATVDRIYTQGFPVSYVTATWTGRPAPHSLTPDATADVAIGEVSATTLSTYGDLQLSTRALATPYVYPRRGPNTTHSLLYLDTGEIVGTTRTDFPYTERTATEQTVLTQTLQLYNGASVGNLLSLPGYGTTTMPLVPNAPAQGPAGTMQPHVQSSCHGVPLLVRRVRKGHLVVWLNPKLGGSVTAFTDTLFALNLKWLRGPLEAAAVQQYTGLPSEPAIIIDPSCQTPQGMAWGEYDPPQEITRLTGRFWDFDDVRNGRSLN